MENENVKFEELVDVFKELGKLQEVWAKQILENYTPIVNNIIRSKSMDKNKIEHVLDDLLNYCFSDEVLLLFKKLCRYFYYIDAETTAFYIYAYRDMWDDNYINKKEIENEK